MAAVFVGLACILPLAVYVLVLSMFHRRPHPVVVTGPWDAAGLLCAASGFLLVAIPYALYRLHDRYGLYFQLNGLLPIPLSRITDLVLAVYVALVVVGAYYLIGHRRRALSIYNVEAEALEDVLTRTFEQLNLTWTRVGRQVFVRAEAAGASVPGDVTHAVRSTVPPGQNGPAEDDSPPVVATAVGAGPVLDLSGPQHLLLELDPFPAMRQVTLTWADEGGRLRQKAEAGLMRALAEVYTPPAAVSAWLGTIASCLFAGTFFTLVFAIAVAVMGLRRE